MSFAAKRRQILDVARHEKVDHPLYSSFKFNSLIISMNIVFGTVETAIFSSIISQNNKRNAGRQSKTLLIQSENSN